MDNTKMKVEKNNRKLFVIVTFVTFVIIGLLFFVAFKYKKQIVVNQDNNIIVAKINDTKITKKEFSLAMSGLVDGVNFNKIQTSTSSIDQEIMVEAMNVLIDKQVLIQKAKAMNITATLVEIDNELIKIKSNYKTYNEYNIELNKLGITEDDLRKDIENQIILSHFETKIIDPIKDTVQEDEIKSFYKALSDKYIEQGSIAPDLELIRDTIIKKIIERRHNLILEEEAKKLRKDAKIEIYI